MLGVLLERFPRMHLTALADRLVRRQSRLVRGVVALPVSH